MVDENFLKSVVNMDDNFWRSLYKIRDAVIKSLEDSREKKIIGSSLEAEIDLYADEINRILLNRLEDEHRFLFIASRSDLHVETERPPTAKEIIPGLWIIVSASIHKKCERCYHRRPEIDMDKRYPGICYRCIDTISGNEPSRKYI